MKFSSLDSEIKKILFSKNSSACEDCFLGFLVWQEKYGFEVIPDNDAFVVRSNNNSAYYIPFSENMENVVSSVKKLLLIPGLILERLTVQHKEFLEKYFPDRFSFEEDRGNADYIYDIQALSTLKGKKLSKKRNHVNGFLNQYENWCVKPVDSSNVQDVINFAENWYKVKEESEGENASLNYEKKALLETIPVLDKIGGDALVLYVNGEVAAFTAGQRISETVYDTVFEKASESIKGSYNMINREFARYLLEKYPSLKYINRESDVNHPGLRQAKLSYMPAFILDKYIARLKN